jgi:rubrerythrin
MSDTEKRKQSATEQAKPGKTETRGPGEICEICGQKMERDPESNEYYCPVCDNPDRQE